MKTPQLHPFWNRVKILIQSQKVNQKEIASQVGVNYSTFRYWICYGLLPDMETATDIADALGVSLEYLIRGAGEQPAEVCKNEVRSRKMPAKAMTRLSGYTLRSS